MSEYEIWILNRTSRFCAPICGLKPQIFFVLSPDNNTGIVYKLKFVFCKGLVVVDTYFTVTRRLSSRTGWGQLHPIPKLRLKLGDKKVGFCG